jgi:hypothetical protein
MLAINTPRHQQNWSLTISTKKGQLERELGSEKKVFARTQLFSKT